MIPSVGLVLLALLRRIRSIGKTLKSFILRCLLFCPQVLRSLRHIWSLFSGRTRTGTNTKDVLKKKGGQAGPPFPRALGACEGYSAIYPSQDFSRTGGPHLGSDNAEAIHLGPMGPSQSAPHSPASSLAPSLPGSERHSPVGSTFIIANAGDIQLPPIPHLNSPITLTHSRGTSAQFAGSSRRSRSRSRSPSPLPHSHTFPQSATLESTAASASPDHSRAPSPFRPPSPLLIPQPHRLPQSTVMDSSSNTQIPDVVISPPSGSQTAETESQSIVNFPQSPLSIQQGHLFQFPTPGAEHSTAGPSDPGSLGLVQGNTRRSSESLRPTNPAQFLNRAPPSFPLPFHSQVTLIDIPIVDASGNWSDGKRRIIGLMHSDQVSRYASKGDV